MAKYSLVEKLTEVSDVIATSSLRVQDPCSRNLNYTERYNMKLS
jgi:hypothetical protein